MSGEDVTTLGNLSEESVLWDSPLYMETNSTTSDLAQNEMKAQRENEGEQLTLSEEIYNTLDNFLGDSHVEAGSQTAVTQPVSSHTSPFSQYAHLCKYHCLQAFHDENVAFPETCPTRADNLPHAEGPVQKDTCCDEAYSKEASSRQGSMAASENMQPSVPVRQLPRNRSQAHSWGDSLEFVPPHSQPCSHLSKESGYWVAGSSHKVQNLRTSSRMVVRVPQEAMDENRENSRHPSTWSTGTSCSKGFSRLKALNSDSEGSEEHPPEAAVEEEEEAGLALNQVLQHLRLANREQRSRIQNLQCNNTQLEWKVTELQAAAAKQQMLVGVVGNLKESMEALIEDKYQAVIEKNEAEHSLQELHAVLDDTQKHLQEAQQDKQTLELKLKTVKASYVHLQEKYLAEVEVSERLSLSAQEAEAKQLQQLRGELEESKSCTQHLLQREKQAREQELLALQEALQEHQKEDQKQQAHVQSRLEELGAQVASLQSLSEKETTRSRQLQEQIHQVAKENARLQLQVASQRRQLPPWRPLEELESDGTKAAAQPAADCVRDEAQPLSPSRGQQGSPSPPYTRKDSPLAAKIHSTLEQMVHFLGCQGLGSPDLDSDWGKHSLSEDESVVQRRKRFQLKKKLLDKELLKHKERIMVFKELVAHRKAFPVQVANFDWSDARSIREVPILLESRLQMYHLLNQKVDFLITKLESLMASKKSHCHRLIEEKDKCQRHVGSLTEKVASYEEIIECADRRLAVSHSHITHLEERNKHLENLIRRPRERARKRRMRGLKA